MHSTHPRKRIPIKFSKIHIFEQLTSHHPLCAQAVYQINTDFTVVVEDSGRLSVLQLDKHGDGGMHRRDEDAEVLAHSLCKQDRPLPDGLRFDPSGSCLFAVDPKGKVVFKDFEKDRSTGRPEIL